VKRLIAFVPLFLTTIVLFAQPEETVDARANSILQSLTKKTKSFRNIKAEFTVTSYGADKKPTDVQKGTLTVSGGKYRLDIKNQLVICDSLNTYTFLKDANEVQINSVDPNAEKGSITPSNIFTIYEKGFKTHFDGEAKQGNATIETIDLYPKHPEKEKYHTLKLSIDKDKNQVIEIQVLLKDGTVTKYTINTFSPNGTLPSSTFKFDKKDFPGAEIEDLRN
jgi:outer membrane lipoprotein-sorting protein